VRQYGGPAGVRPSRRSPVRKPGRGIRQHR
jgi:hypothetical protein